MVVEFEEALELVRRAAECLQPARMEWVRLLESAGRVLAEAVRADREQPGFDRATRDGFAMKAAEAGAWLRVAGMVKAGERLGRRMEAGEAVQVMTGAPLPEGADAVAMVEHVEREGGRVRLAVGRGLRAGENWVPRGSEAAMGAVVVAASVVMGAAEIAAAASCGCSELRVWARPRVGVVATGDELVEVEETPGEAEIRNSNGYAIAAMVAAAGGDAVREKIARDVREEIAASVRRARVGGLMVLSGGVSMGEYDLVEEVLAGEGAEFWLTGVRMQPGRPVVFGRLPGRGDDAQECWFFGLPGNPVSTEVTFRCFVEPFLRAMAGAGWVGPRWGMAVVGEAIAAKEGLTRLLPARIASEEDEVRVRVVGWQGSGDLAANARANGYVELRPGRGYGVGEVVRVLVR